MWTCRTFPGGLLGSGLWEEKDCFAAHCDHFAQHFAHEISHIHSNSDFTIAVMKSVGSRVQLLVWNAFCSFCGCGQDSWKLEIYHLALVPPGFLNLPVGAGRLSPGDGKCLPEKGSSHPCLKASRSTSTPKETYSGPRRVE